MTNLLKGLRPRLIKKILCSIKLEDLKMETSTEDKMAQIPNEIIIKFDDDLKERVTKWIEDDFIPKKVIKLVVNEIVKSRENTCSAEWFDFANEIEKRLNL